MNYLIMYYGHAIESGESFLYLNQKINKEAQEHK
jgi:hypothetical protein